MTVALLFSGQGAQQVGMGQSLYNNSAEAKQLFEQANNIIGYNLSQICFEGPDTKLTDASHCQPALFVHGYAIYRTLQAEGLLPNLNAVLGLSLGELTAMAVAGVFNFETGLKIVAKRGQLMQEACQQTQGGMACLIGGDIETIQALCKEFDVEMANLNCPGQIVISGQKDKILAASEKAQTLDFKRVVPLNVAGAFHSKLMDSARSAFRSYLQDIPFNKPEITVFTNTTGQSIESPQAIKDALTEQIVAPVRWEECMHNAIKLGIETFYECGPGKVLTGLAKRIDKTASVYPISDWEDMPASIQHS